LYLRGSLCAAASLLLAFSYMACANAPVLVTDINTQPIGVSSNPVFLGTLCSTTFFSATDGVHGVELWKTDGTTAGTVMVVHFARVHRQRR
jgi:ELWxxDGT repeat protein